MVFKNYLDLQILILFLPTFLSINILSESANVDTSSPVTKKSLLGSAQTFATGLIKSTKQEGSLTNLATKVVTKTAGNVIKKKIKEETGIDVSKLPDPRIIPPLFNFIVGLPKYFVESLQKWAYSNPTINIANQPPNPSTTPSTSEADTQNSSNSSDSQETNISNLLNELQDFLKVDVKINLQIGLGFNGHGDPNGPIGYLLTKTGKYYYTPGVNLLSIKVANEPSVKIQNILQGELKKLLVLAFKTMNAQSAANITEDSLNKTAEVLNRIAISKPEDIFAFKIFQLCGAAITNSKNNSNYPRIAHIPAEMAILFHKLSVTPDFEATMQNHSNKVKNAYEWDKSKIIYFTDPLSVLEKSFLLVPAGMFTWIENSIPCSVSSQEWQEYQGSKDTMIKDDSLKLAIAKSWKILGFNKRSDAIVSNIIQPANFGAYTYQEQLLFIKAISHHVSKRHDGLALFLEMCTEFLNDPASFSDIINAETMFTLTTFLKILETRHLKVKNICNKALSLLSSFTKGNDSLVDQASKYLNEQLDAMDEITSDCINIIEKANSNEEPNILEKIDELNKLFLESDSKIKFKITDGAENETSDNSSETSTTVPLKFREFVTLQAWKFNNYLDIRFRGDAGFIENPLPLSLQEAIQYALAVILRAIKDTAKATDLFKEDNNQYDMVDLTGAKTKIVGSNLFKKTKVTASNYAEALAKEQYQSKMESINQGKISAKESSLESTTKAVEKITAALNTEFCHYLRQYHFDRRLTNNKSFSIGSTVVVESPPVLTLEEKKGEKTTTSKEKDSKVEEKTQNKKETVTNKENIKNSAKIESATTSSQETPQTIALPFQSHATTYPDSINSFLREEFINIAKRSTEFIEAGSLYIDPILISLFGCNISTLLLSLKEAELQANQEEIEELMISELDNNGAFAALKESLKKLQTKKENVAEQAEIKTDPSLLTPEELSEITTHLMQIPQYKVSAEISAKMRLDKGPISIKVSKDNDSQDFMDYKEKAPASTIQDSSQKDSIDQSTTADTESIEIKKTEEHPSEVSFVEG